MSTWGGAFENMERANARLMIVVPITLGLVFFLLFWAFHSLRYATLIIINLPFALIGGVVSLWLSGQYLSVPASIGFIELFGLAVGNGIVLVSYINQLRNEGTQMDQAIVTGCSLRLRPVVMTMMTTLLGLSAVGTGAGDWGRSPATTRDSRHRWAFHIDGTHAGGLAGLISLVRRERSGKGVCAGMGVRGGWSVDLLCSRNARPKKALVGRAQWEIKQTTLP